MAYFANNAVPPNTPMTAQPPTVVPPTMTVPPHHPGAAQLTPQVITAAATGAQSVVQVNGSVHPDDVIMPSVPSVPPTVAAAVTLQSSTNVVNVAPTTLQNIQSGQQQNLQQANQLPIVPPNVGMVSQLNNQQQTDDVITHSAAQHHVETSHHDLIVENNIEQNEQKSPEPEPVDESLSHDPGKIVFQKETILNESTSKLI